MRLAIFLTTVLFLVLPADFAFGQAMPQTTRSMVYAPSAMGMGNATVAIPSLETGFYYNPAHFGFSVGDDVHMRPFGLQASRSPDALDQWSYYQNDFGPAMREGISNMPEDEQQALFDDALLINSRQGVIVGDIMFPALAFRLGDVAFSGGVFAHSVARSNVDEAPGAPFFQGTMHTDLTAIGAASAEFSAIGLRGFYAGAAVKHVRRYMTLKSKPLDEFQEDEDFYLKEAISTGVDLGALYALPLEALPGQLFLGGSVHDMFTDGFNYRFIRSLTEYAEEDPVQADTETRVANNRYNLVPSHRIGAGYAVSFSSFLAGQFAFDYIGFEDETDRTPLMHTRFGGELTFFDILSLRTGLNQGHPTAGAGISVGGGIDVDYAYYGLEEGGSHGSLSRWNHSLRIGIGF